MTPDTQRIFTVAEVERLERENAEMRAALVRILDYAHDQETHGSGLMHAVWAIDVANRALARR